MNSNEMASDKLGAVQPQYLIRDRDRVYGEIFKRRLHAMGIRDRPVAPRSPWQNGYCERLIGSIRQECLDHIVIFGERHLRHILLSYMEYYNGARTHLSLNKDAPVSRAVQARRAHSPKTDFSVDDTITMVGSRFPTGTSGCGYCIARIRLACRAALALAAFLIVWGQEPKRTEEFVGRSPYGNHLLKTLAQLDLAL